PESFGARLRQQRERQNISLTSIAEGTKIGLSLLEGLERDDVSHWPSGIFRRAFMRAYAQAIGLEPDRTVREFVECYPDPVEEVPWAALVSAAKNGGATEAPPIRLRQLFGSAMGYLSGRRAEQDLEEVRPPVAQRTRTRQAQEVLAVQEVHDRADS